MLSHGFFGADKLEFDSVVERRQPVDGLTLPTTAPVDTSCHWEGDGEEVAAGYR